MKHGSLFSGIGGFDLAAQWMGWENVFHCEWNEFGQKVLKHHFPKSISYNDITKTDFTIHRGEIDILTGGFPCQPYSVAGKRKGKEDERHLWPEMLRAIREIQPSYVVGENVGGILSWSGGLVFEEVQTDLEAEGYEILTFILPACAVNAPHRRDRVWFVANCSNARVEGLRESEIDLYGFNSFANTESKRSPVLPIRNESKHSKYGSNGSNGVIADTNLKRYEEQHFATFTNKQSGQHSKTDIASRPSSWQNFPTQSTLCSRNDGIPSELVGITFPKHRNESIKAYGNAIVPQVAYEIFKAIELTEKI